MKEYPKINGFDKQYLNKPCVAFFKYDGSNLRFSYSRKQKKWYKFGTRRHLFAESDVEYGASIPVFYSKYAVGLERTFHDHKLWKNAESMTVFAEYFGPNSFSGQHKQEDPKDLVLFDVNIHKRGILGPKDFLESFGHLPVAKVIYQGVFTEELFHDVRNGKYDLDEGVICKGGFNHDLWMVKIKTLKYLEKLKALYSERWHDFWE